jgi:hypothetical protein
MGYSHGAAVALFVASKKIRWPFIASELIKVPGLPDWSNCKKEELLLLQDDGAWYSPHLNKTFDEVNPYGEYTSNCRIDGEALLPVTTKRK